MTQRPSILGSGRRSRAEEWGSSNAEATVGRRGSSDVRGSKPRPGAWHLGKRQCGSRTSCRCTPCQPGALPLPQASAQHLHGRLCWRRQVRPCLGTLLPVRAGSWPCPCPCVISREAAARPQAEGSVFLSVQAFTAASPPEALAQLHQKLALLSGRACW